MLERQRLLRGSARGRGSEGSEGSEENEAGKRRHKISVQEGMI
jgi:hypothetical protein